MKKEKKEGGTAENKCMKMTRRELHIGTDVSKGGR